MKLTRYLIALYIIAIGCFLLTNQLGLTSIGQLSVDHILQAFWGLLLFTIGLHLLLHCKYFFGTVITALGILVITDIFVSTDISNVFWPIVLIAFGMNLLIGSKSYTTHRFDKKIWTKVKNKTTDTLNDEHIFGNANKKIVSEDFKGGEVTAIFGEVFLDLTGAKVIGSKDLAITAVFGKIKVKLPKDCSIISNGVPVLGTWDNDFSERESLNTLTISGSSVFGKVLLTE